jgi:hypothetical protein
MTVNQVTVKGFVAPRFEAVRDAFSEIFGAHRGPARRCNWGWYRDLDALARSLRQAHPLHLVRGAAAFAGLVRAI